MFYLDHFNPRLCSVHIKCHVEVLFSKLEAFKIMINSLLLCINVRVSSVLHGVILLLQGASSLCLFPNI